MKNLKLIFLCSVITGFSIFSFVKSQIPESIKLNSIERNISLNLVNAGSENSYGGLCCQWLNRGCHHPNGWSFADALWIGSSDFCP
jgi:hypothetical protein